MLTPLGKFVRAIVRKEHGINRWLDVKTIDNDMIRRHEFRCIPKLIEEFGY